MTTTIQKVRELQEQIRASEAKLLELTQQPEYAAEQAFIQDVMDVLDMHNRTLREAVLAIDPSLLAPVAKLKKTRGPYSKEAKPEPFKLDEPNAVPPPGVLPEQKKEISPKTGKPKRARRVREPGAPPLTSPAKQAWNQKRNDEVRVKAIREGRWFLFTNPHTGETCEGAKVNNDTLRMWAAEYGRGAVDKWKRPLTNEEAGLA